MGREKQNLNSSTQIQYNDSIFIQANNLVHCLRNALLNPFDNKTESKHDLNFCQKTSEVDQLHAVESNLDSSASKVSYNSLRSSKSKDKKKKSKSSTKIELKKDETSDENRNDDQLRKFI